MQLTVSDFQPRTTPERIAFLIKVYPDSVNLDDKYSYLLEKYKQHFGRLTIKESTFEREVRHYIAKNPHLRDTRATFATYAKEKHWREHYAHH